MVNRRYYKKWYVQIVSKSTSTSPSMVKQGCPVIDFPAWQHCPGWGQPRLFDEAASHHPPPPCQLAAQPAFPASAGHPVLPRANHQRCPQPSEQRQYLQRRIDHHTLPSLHCMHVSHRCFQFGRNLRTSRTSIFELQTWGLSNWNVDLGSQYLYCRPGVSVFELQTWGLSIWNADLGSHYWASRSR